MACVCERQVVREWENELCETSQRVNVSQYMSNKQPIIPCWFLVLLNDLNELKACLPIIFSPHVLGWG